MDNRLMPPSHFDPNERDSLEGTPSTSAHDPDSAFVPNQYLCPPGDFSPDTKPSLEKTTAPFLRIGRPQAYTMESNNLTPGFYKTPPQITRNRGFSALPTAVDSKITHQNIAGNNPDLLRLQAENEALKSVIQCKKAKMETQMQEHASRGQYAAQQAVIEHQTQHIARLQMDVEEQKSRLGKRDNEISHYEGAVATKEKENRKLVGSVELLELELDKKNEQEKMKDQEIEALRKIVRDLRTEKEELSKSHSEKLELMEQRCNSEKESCIRDLTAKINELSASLSEEKAEWQRKIDLLGNQHKKEIEVLRDGHQKQQIIWKKQADEIDESKTIEIGRIESDLANEKNKTDSLLKSLTQEKLEIEKLQTAISELQAAIETSEQASEKHLDRVNQLQTYIGKQQTEDYERSQWQNNKKHYEDTIMALHNEKDTMNKTLELQNVRLQSITKILTTQEEAIHANAKSFSSGNVKGNPAHVVVRRWREKVFELMVQCKSNEISMKTIEDKFKLAANDLRERLEEETRVNIILESQLSECKAQLEMKQGDNESLSIKNGQLSEKLSETTINATSLEELVVTMSEQVARSTGELCQHFHDKFSTLAEKMVHLEQRLVFANNRLRTLPDLFVRRENLWKAKLKQVREHASHSTEPTPAIKEDFPSQIERPDLVAEIQQLTKERDTLSQRLSSDSAAFETTTSRFRERESDLEKELTALQSDIQQKSEENAELKLRLENVEEKLKDQERAASDAKESAKLSEENKDKFAEQKVEEAWKTWDVEKRDIEKRLEESQREHARTVVTSRQSDRTAVREKKRAEENLQAVIGEHKIEAEKLQSKLKALKRDNNLLMTTLRQQGLISTFKAARARAKIQENQIEVSHHDTSPKRSPVKSKSTGTCATMSDKNMTEKSSTLDNASTSHCIGIGASSTTLNVDPLPPQKAKDSNMAEMLKDLVVLTENILDDSE